MIPEVLGGLGLFLLGMALLTDGLKALAGPGFKRTLARFTGGRLKAILSGAAATAVVQSSSATTLTTIGLVSAGLLTFPQAVGVIFGANIGTTSTAWIVALFGLKFSIAKVALPLVGVGALVRLMGRDRWALMGTALAGFGLIFVGIDVLQLGMSQLSDQVDLSVLAGRGVLGVVLLVLAGIVMTVILQSSSAAVAATQVALYEGAIGLPEAAALVIGQNIGTTVTAVLAAVGGSILAKRTAAAHVAFNVGTGLIALVLLPVFLTISLDLAALGPQNGDPATFALASFHTLFNVIGVIVFFPLTHLLTAQLERWVPDPPGRLRVDLDVTIARIPSVAVEASRRALADIAAEVTAILEHRIRPGPEPRDLAMRLEEAHAATQRVQDLLGLLRTESESDETHRAHVDLLHAADHLLRLTLVARGREAAANLRNDPLAEPVHHRLEQALTDSVSWLTGASQASGALARDRLLSIRTLRAELRSTYLHSIADSLLDAEQARVLLDALGWADGAAGHLEQVLARLGAPGPVASHG